MTMKQGARRLRDCDRGNATVEFALVAPMLLALALAVLQLALVLHVRTTLTAAAAEGARAAALAGADLSAGERRARALLDGNIAGDVVESIEVQRLRHGSALLLAVRINARLPLLGMLGPTAMVVEGHAVQERA